MRLVRRSLSKVLVFALALTWFGCASDEATNIEEAQFLLDNGQFVEAEVAARAALAGNPDSVDATYLLASALFGQSVLGDESTFLTLLSRALEDQGNDTELQTFARIAPVLQGSDLEDLEEATDILNALPDLSKDEDIYLLLYATRMFEIAAAVTQIGGSSDDLTCNYGGGDEPDGVPDDLFSDDDHQLSSTRNQRFRTNLNEAPLEAERGGLPEDFDITSRFSTMLDELDAAIAAAPDVDTGTQDYLTDQFPVSASSGCNLAP